MGKRIFRLNAKEASLKIDFLIRKELSIVLIDGRVFQGTIIKFDSDSFLCENKLKVGFTNPALWALPKINCSAKLT